MRGDEDLRTQIVDFEIRSGWSLAGPRLQLGPSYREVDLVETFCADQTSAERRLLPYVRGKSITIGSINRKGPDRGTGRSIAKLVFHPMDGRWTLQVLNSEYRWTVYSARRYKRIERLLELIMEDDGHVFWN
jgi:DUF3024 family protein